jgi:hypothetical protein
MPASTSTSHLTISSAEAKPKLSAAQRKFNGLLKKIDKQRQNLQAWEAAISKHQQRWHEEFRPLHVQLVEHKQSILIVLDHAADHIKLAKTDRQTLQAILCELVTSLMDGDNREQMKALYNKHSGGDFDVDEQQRKRVLKEAIEQSFEIKLDDDFDLNSPEALVRHLQDHLEQSEKPQQASNAREQRDQDHAKQASQAMREVYRKLASALHPDREADEDERQRKTILMQRVNQAYAERNLLELLELQLEAEHLDPQTLQEMSDVRLTHYNRILSEQLEELIMEINAITFDFSRQFNVEPFARVTVANSQKHVNLALRELVLRISNMGRHIAEIQTPKGLKRWLKAEREAMEEDFDEFDFFDEADFPDDFPGHSKPGKA